MQCWAQTCNALSRTAEAGPVPVWTPDTDPSSSDASYHAVTLTSLLVDTGSCEGQTACCTCSVLTGTPVGHPCKATEPNDVYR